MFLVITIHPHFQSHLIMKILKLKVLKKQNCFSVFVTQYIEEKCKSNTEFSLTLIIIVKHNTLFQQTQS